MVFTITGITSFDYFFSIFFYFLCVILPVFAGLVLFTKKV